MAQCNSQAVELMNMRFLFEERSSESETEELQGIMKKCVGNSDNNPSGLVKSEQN